MPFTAYTSITDVAHRHSIRCQRAGFLEPVAATLSEHFRSELEFTLDEVPYDGSESAACETLIYPLLREVWKPYWRELTLWSHESIRHDDDLCGVPDYIVARRSPLGSIIFDIPYLLVVEAKRENFSVGWGQCLAAMRAAQKINGQLGETLFGITTTGKSWEFGLLRGDDFTQENQTFSMRDLDDLAAAIHFIMLQCRDQAAQLAVPA